MIHSTAGNTEINNQNYRKEKKGKERSRSRKYKNHRIPSLLK
jgi:hypothetical protein